MKNKTKEKKHLRNHHQKKMKGDQGLDVSGLNRKDMAALSRSLWKAQSEKKKKNTKKQTSNTMQKKFRQKNKYFCPQKYEGSFPLGKPKFT